MLHHADDFDVTKRLALQCLVNGLGVDRLVTILQSNLKDPVIDTRNLRDLVSIRNGGCNRLLNQNVLTGFHRTSNYVNVRIIRRADYQAIDIWVRTGFHDRRI